MSIAESRVASFSCKAKILAVGSIVLIAMSAGPAKAEFCEEFNGIVATAGEGFAEFRGELVTGHVDPVSDTRVVWECLRALPGADRCEVEWLRQTYSYTLHWLRPDLEGHQEAFSAVRELLAGCGATERQVSKSGKSIWLVVDGQENLDVVLTYNSNRVRLSLSAVGFQNPGVQ